MFFYTFDFLFLSGISVSSPSEWFFHLVFYALPKHVFLTWKYEIKSFRISKAAVFSSSCSTSPLKNKRSLTCSLFVIIDVLSYLYFVIWQLQMASSLQPFSSVLNFVCGLWKTMYQVLLNGLADDWPARNTWTIDQLSMKYGDKAFRISQRSSRKVSMKFKDYVSYMKFQHDEDPLYIFDDKVLSHCLWLCMWLFVSIRCFMLDFYSCSLGKLHPAYWKITVCPIYFKKTFLKS